MEKLFLKATANCDSGKVFVEVVTAKPFPAKSLVNSNGKNIFQRNIRKTFLQKLIPAKISSLKIEIL